MCSPAFNSYRISFTSLPIVLIFTPTLSQRGRGGVVVKKCHNVGERRVELSSCTGSKQNLKTHNRHLNWDTFINKKKV